jgi:hypothetical protein
VEERQFGSAAEANYAGYCAASDGKSLVTGEPLPGWDAVQPRIKAAWASGSRWLLGWLAGQSSSKSGVAAIAAESIQLRERAEHAEAERDKAYRERAALVAYLAANCRSVIMHDADPDAPGWSAIFVETPSGQMSWHLAEADLDLFRHVPKVLRHFKTPWDGHTTDEKYQRLAELARTVATGIYGQPQLPASPSQARRVSAEDGH